MALANYQDANDFLDENKLKFSNDVDAEREAEEADRIVRAKLYDVYEDKVNDWAWDDGTDPTPEIIRTIAGLLMASIRYAKRYSEETMDESSYANRLKAQAMELIQGIRDGTIELADAPTLTGVGWSRNEFWPNQNTTKEDEPSEPLRFFEMEQTF